MYVVCVVCVVCVCVCLLLLLLEANHSYSEHTLNTISNWSLFTPQVLKKITAIRIQLVIWYLYEVF